MPATAQLVDNGARLGQGNVQLILGQESIELKPTVYAMQQISRTFGGLQGAIEKISALDINVIHEIIVLGAGNAYNNAKSRQALLEKIFAAGLAGPGTDEVAERAIEYVSSLMRGGRPRPAAAGGDSEGGEGNVRSSS